jgi:hypothetical protein
VLLFIRPLLVVWLLAVVVASPGGAGGGCASMRAPHISTLYTGPGTPTPKPDSATVEVFLAGTPPERAYTVLGEVQITTDREKRSAQEVLDYAKAEARKLGGDALVDVGTSSEVIPGGVRSYTNLYNGKEEHDTYGPGQRRILKGKAVAWK